MDAQELVGSPRYAWATPDVINLARHALEQPMGSEPWGALAEALPTLRAMHARADDPALRKAMRRRLQSWRGFNKCLKD